MVLTHRLNSLVQGTRVFNPTRIQKLIIQTHIHAGDFSALSLEAKQNVRRLLLDTNIYLHLEINIVFF